MDPELRHAVEHACAEANRLTCGRVVSSYVVGSRADGSAVPSSDVDILLVISGEQDIEASSLAAAARHVPDLRADFIVRSMDYYRRNGGPPLSEVGIQRVRAGRLASDTTGGN